MRSGHGPLKQNRKDFRRFLLIFRQLFTKIILPGIWAVIFFLRISLVVINNVVTGAWCTCNAEASQSSRRERPSIRLSDPWRQIRDKKV
jgi:hypothetical protein